MPNLFILYVKDPAASAAFYTDLLGHEPQHAFPNFVSYDLGSGFTLGLWAAHGVAHLAAGNRSELAFTVPEAEVEVRYRNWTARGITIEQELTTAVFGPTFVALDPDGHRLRVCIADA